MTPYKLYMFCKMQTTLNWQSFCLSWFYVRVDWDVRMLAPCKTYFWTGDESKHLYEMYVLSACGFSWGNLTVQFIWISEMHYPNGTVIPSVYDGQDGGCPTEYKWCHTTPSLPFPQFIAAVTIGGIGYPMSAVTLNILYSKVIGPFPQV